MGARLSGTLVSHSEVLACIEMTRIGMSVLQFLVYL